MTWIKCIYLTFLIVFIVDLETTKALYHNSFITLRKSATNWSVPEEWPEDVVTTTHAALKYHRRSMEPTYFIYGNPYKLRFNAMPRLFWHKFPQKQEEQPQTTQMPGEVTPMPSEPMEPEVTESPETEAPPTPPPSPPPETEAPAPDPKPEPEPEPELPTEIPPNMMMTTTAKPSVMSSTVQTLKPSTTFSTIMKPAGYFPYNIADKLKNLLAFGSPAQVNLLQKHGNSAKVKTKSKGFLSLFEVIKFDNTKCSVNMGDIRSMEGVCYHEFECKSLGGIPTERCADGVGVCCIFLTGCGDTTIQSVVYFESPNYPQAFREMMICVLVVNLRKNVQQMRLDFLMFELNRPTDGDCEEDQFVVSGQNLNFVIPVLCGINTGQHIYIHVGDSPDRKIYLPIFAKVPTGARSFNLKITQLEDNFAPDGCLQYYTDQEGIIKSFNYDTEGTVVDDKIATYLNNMNYVICLERAKDTCSVNYVMEQIGGSSEQLDFQIVNKNEDEIDLVPDGQAGAGIFNCPDDFVAINQVRLCGERFNDGTENEDFTMHAPVRDVAAGPIILPFRSDDEYVGRGFRLAYRQESCIPNLAPPKPLL